MIQEQVQIVPLTLPAANAVVAAIHRHHPPLPAGFSWFSVGAIAGNVLRGVAIAGRPTNRNNDDGQTVEVLRIAADGTPNVCSALLGACARAAKAIGAYRCITYTLEHESGVSLKAAGWIREEDGIKSWWTTPTEGRSPGVQRLHSDLLKVRYSITFHQPITFLDPYTHAPEELPQLF